MTISRRGLFGTLLGGIAAGYAAKAAPAYATGDVLAVERLERVWSALTLKTSGYISGFVGESVGETIMPFGSRWMTPGEVRDAMSLPPLTISIDDGALAENLRYLEQRNMINDAVAQAMRGGQTLLSGQVKTVTVTGGCTRDGDEEQAS